MKIRIILFGIICSVVVACQNPQTAQSKADKQDKSEEKQSRECELGQLPNLVPMQIIGNNNACYSGEFRVSGTGNRRYAFRGDSFKDTQVDETTDVFLWKLKGWVDESFFSHRWSVDITANDQIVYIKFLGPSHDAGFETLFDTNDSNISIVNCRNYFELTFLENYTFKGAGMMCFDLCTIEKGSSLTILTDEDFCS